MEHGTARETVLDRFGRAFYPVAITAVVAVLAAVEVFLQREFAVYGLYALFGLVVGAMVYYGTSDIAGSLRIDERLHQTGVYVTAAVTVGLVALVREPMIVVPGLVVGYALVVRQLFADPVPKRVVPQIAALFMLSPITKYLTAGVYIGHGDILVHLRLVEDILAGESVNAIAYSSYADFPGLHLVAAMAGSLSGLGAYDGLMMTGLAAYAILVPAVYLVAVGVTDHPLLALYTAFAVAVLDDFSFYASYIFPQSLATILIVVLAVLAILVSKNGFEWPAVGAFVLVALALSYTHHLTQVLFVPVVVLALLLYSLHGVEYTREVIVSRQLALLVFALAITTGRLMRTGFVDRLVRQGTALVAGGVRGGYTRSLEFGFGRAADRRSVATALEWLVSPYAVYLILLVLVFSVGLVAFLRATERSVVQSALFWTGALGSVLIFETPISIQSLIRISMPWLFVFAFVVGVGLLQFRRRIGPSRRSHVLLAVVVLFAATGPITAADDYYDLDPRPGQQTSLSDEEAAELDALAGWMTDREVSASSLWLSRLSMRRHGVPDTRHTRIDDRTVMIPEGHFLYREAWSDHKVHFTSGGPDRLYSNTMYVSERWLDRRVASESKVYSAGGTGVMWNSTARPFGDGR